MTPRERFLQTVLFGRPDRVPLEPGQGRKSTRENWFGQGLPHDTPDIYEYAYRQAGGKLPWPKAGESFAVNERMIPEFEEKVIERRERTQIVQDWKGNICEIGIEFTPEYLRNPIDFVTRRWIKCPVGSRADWDEMRRRYDADEPSRLPADAAGRGKRLANRDWPICVSFSGPFWQLREWMGFEGLCVAFYDEPELVREMVEFWQAHVARLLERLFEVVIPDEIRISEDMAYKGHAMISPKMMREFLLPTWARWGGMIRKAGVRVYSVDSDGFVGEIIALWMEAGVNLVEPMEVAAGNDLALFRREFGGKMAFRGGVDKRAMAKGGRAIEDEIKHLTPLIRDGGFIPSCDHGVPPDVSWANFVDYTRLLAKATGWL